MMKEISEKILLVPLEFLPLKTNAFIVEGNALRGGSGSRRGSQK